MATKNKAVDKKLLNEPAAAVSAEVRLEDLPPVPVLQRALVTWSTNNGTQKDLPAALLARRLCRSGCFFCGKAEDNPSMAGDVPWSEIEVCGCLPTEDRYTDPDWGKSTPAPGYVELLPRWQERQAELAEKAGAGLLDNRRPVYGNICVVCDTAFQVPVTVVAASIRKHGGHAVMNRCRSCKDASMRGAKPRNKAEATVNGEVA